MAKLDDMRRPLREPSTAAMFVYLMIGPILWGLHLLIVYGLHTLICALGGPASAAAAALFAATASAAVVIALVVLMQRRAGRLFGIGDEMVERQSYDDISRILGILSLAGVLWSGTAVAVLSSCAPGR